MPRNLADRIRDKIRAYATDPASQANNVSRLRGPEAILRLRVGDWRVLFRDEHRIEVLDIGPRSSVYRE